MGFKIKIEPEAKEDIQSSIDWYNQQKKGLGKRFLKEVQKAFDTLSKNPFYQKRYENIFCFPIKKYPYMVHFTIDEVNNTVIVRGVFHTALDPKNWTKRTK
jgi:mRNA-degrading endonuclease RelE of RelBE toxin-antitoxin system